MKHVLYNMIKYVSELNRSRKILYISIFTEIIAFAISSILSWSTTNTIIFMTTINNLSSDLKIDDRI